MFDAPPNGFGADFDQDSTRVANAIFTSDISHAFSAFFGMVFANGHFDASLSDGNGIRGPHQDAISIRQILFMTPLDLHGLCAIGRK